MNMRPALLAGIALMGMGIAGCGEKPQVTVYKQGQYQGKPDNVPWQSAPFNNKLEWEKTSRHAT